MVYNNIAALKTKTFPWKLHAMLELAEQDGFNGVVSWLPDGKSFKVYDPPTFVKEIMPNFFQQSKYKSFQRQLNLWGFERITAGPGKGGYTRSHHFFRKNRDQICHIQRRKIKNTRFPRKKNPTEIVEVGTSKFNIEQRKQFSSSASVVSNSCSDVSSISSDSDGEQSSAFSSKNEDFSPMPLSEIIEENYCPQTGDCLDFEGRSYFFVDEEEVEATRMKAASNIVSPLPSNIVSPLRRSPTRTPEEITLCPSSIAGIALYREFFSRDMMAPRLSGLRT